MPPEPTPTTTLPLDWPPLRKAAEAYTQEAYTLFQRVGQGPRWEALLDNPETAQIRDLLVDTQAALLSDLTRPASRDHWARWWKAHTRAATAMGVLARAEASAVLRHNPRALRRALLAFPPVSDAP